MLPPRLSDAFLQAAQIRLIPVLRLPRGGTRCISVLGDLLPVDRQRLLLVFSGGLQTKQQNDAQVCRPDLGGLCVLEAAFA